MRAANKRRAAEEAEAQNRANAARRARRLTERKADSMPAVEAPDGPRQVRVVDGPLRDPAPRGGVLEVLQQPYLLRLIVGRELASMYAASLLGLLWSYIQPAMRFAVYYLVMGFILKLHENFPYFALHLFTGIVFVHYFTETWSGGTRSIWQNRALVMKMRIPREIFPIASMVVAAYHTLPQVLLLTFFCIISGWNITWGAVAAGLLGLLILTLFATALALFFSALNVFFRDFQNIVLTLLQFLHFMVPMMYPFSRVWSAHAGHPLLYNLYMANPVAEAVLLLQKFFWFSVVDDRHKLGRSFPPDLWTRGLIMLVVSAGLLYLAQRFFSRLEGKFPERM
jgi:ABC-2 type transport system permease protein